MTSCRPDRRPRSRAAALALALGAVTQLGACSSDKTADWSAVYGIVSNVFGGRQEGITLQQAAAVPFASIGVRVDDGPEGMLVLAQSARDQQLWTAASHIVLLIRNGRIIRTAGLEYNLSDMRILKGDNSPPPLRGSAETTWEMDFAELKLYSAPVVCRSIVRGSAHVKNFTSSIPTVKVDEECRSDKLDWSFVNSYWIAPKTGVVWRSIQHINPKSDPIETELLRAPS